jgi:Heterokaryon incompatibility protein (HET)
MDSSNIYEALDSKTKEIRILTLRSCQHNRNSQLDEQKIVCVLENTSLEGAVEYMALSYAWENGSRAQAISISGTERLVSANLVDALRQLRNESDDVVLWADQLCINQNDPAEKASQIQIMGSIYKNAVQVISWVGIAADDSDLVLTTLHRIERHYFSPEKSGILSSIIQDLEKSTSHDQIWDKSRILDNLRTAFPAFAARRYWTRLWMLQEFVLAKNVLVMCGSKTMPDLAFKNAWEVLGRAANKPDRFIPGSEIVAIAETWSHDSKWWDSWLGLKRLIAAREDYHMERPLNKSYDIMDSDLFDVMFKTLTTFSGQTTMSCSDPRDRVFSLLGLATDSHRFGHFPDYTKSTESTYEELARNFIQLGHVDTFSLCQEDPTRRKRKMASWAADWSLKIRLPLWGKLYLNASQDWHLDSAPSFLDDNSIVMSGTCVGTIQSHGPRWSQEVPLTLPQIQTFLQQLSAFCNRSNGIHANNKERLCAQTAAPAALAYLQSGKRMLKQYREMLNRLDGIANLSDEPEPQIIIEGPSTYERELQRQVFRCPFITENGYVGIAPPYIQEGDCVCIFPRARMPYILRPESENNAFRLVGGAYVHSIMHGEFFEAEREVQTFNIV